MLDSKPYKIFETWYAEAKSHEDSYPDGFTLATATSDGVPSARIVLLKKVLNEGFVFFTNYNSQKGKELKDNPHAHMLFYWKSTQRQIRVQGTITKASKEVSDEYWASRASNSRLNAALSKQSSPIEEGFEYKEKIEELNSRNLHAAKRPENWGGFVISPTYFEFWEEGDYRWHKREAFSLKAPNSWESTLLYP